MRTSKRITIVTHSGSFHTDDIFAVATLELYLEQTAADAQLEIIRTRDTEKIASADFVVDVGHEHDPEKRRFDHHQKAGAGERENGIPYAAFGLVWKAYGEAVSGTAAVAELVDSRLVQAVDAPDNGVSLTGESSIPDASPYFLGDAVNVFKPTWREDQDDVDDTFLALVGVAKTLLRREIHVAEDRVEGARLVEEAYQAAEDKRIIWMERNLPHNYPLRQHPEPLFAAYPKGDEWRLRAIIGENFAARAQLPERWRGNRAAELVEATGVAEAKFCHRSLPLITAESKAAIAKLADMALDWREG